jgi:hypothetical protein
MKKDLFIVLLSSFIFFFFNLNETISKTVAENIVPPQIQIKKISPLEIKIIGPLLEVPRHYIDPTEIKDSMKITGGPGPSTFPSVPGAIKDTSQFFPKFVQPAIPFVATITPEALKPILPDEERDDDAIVQINNLKITRIITSAPDTQGIIFAVRDVGWKCSFYKSEESDISMPCDAPLRKSIIRKELVIKIVDDTILLLRNRKRAKLTDFQIGDKINVYGYMDKDNYGIEALIVRNLSRHSLKKADKKQYITLLSPNGGEVWIDKMAERITWKASDKIDYVDIELLEGYFEYSTKNYQVIRECPIATSVPASLGYYELDPEWKWFFKCNLNEGGDNYKIRIKGYISPQKSLFQNENLQLLEDQSDGVFGIYYTSDDYKYIAPTNPQIHYQSLWVSGGYLQGVLFRSDNGGRTWKEIRRQQKGGIIFSVHPKNPYLIYAGDTGGNQMGDLDIDLVKSYNGGDSWIDISKGLIKEGEILYGILEIELDPDNPNIVEVVVSSTKPGKGFSELRLRSTDGGTTWKIKE